MRFHGGIAYENWRVLYAFKELIFFSQWDFDHLYIVLIWYSLDRAVDLEMD